MSIQIPKGISPQGEISRWRAAIESAVALPICYHKAACDELLRRCTMWGTCPLAEILTGIVPLDNVRWDGVITALRHEQLAYWQLFVLLTSHLQDGLIDDALDDYLALEHLVPRDDLITALQSL